MEKMGQGPSCGSNHELGIFRAVQIGDKVTLDAMLERDPSLLFETTLYDHQSLLHIAAASGQIAILPMLLERSVNPEQKEKKNVSPQGRKPRSVSQLDQVNNC